MKVAVEAYSEAIKEALQNGLHAYNVSQVPDAPWHEIAVTIRDDGGAICGGAIAYLFGDNCYIDTVWTGDAARGRGFGRRIVCMVEDEARKLGARGVWLYTASFQAKPFYEKLGYTQFGELQWPGSDLKRHFMRKAL
ncbi:MAG TPA: GNAT family N-acetyltransferase [Rhizomicrobium sp.]